MLTPTELKFQVPWGHVAAVAWGSCEDSPVLVVHGTMDNAGSFKRLIQHLPETHYYVCIDLPGHGLSSHFPSGLNLDFYNFVLTIGYVLDELKWPKCLYLGHSFGGQVGVMHAILFPGRIERLVVIDALLSRHYSPEEVMQRLRTTHSATLHALAKADPGLHTKEQVLEAIQLKRHHHMNQAAADALFDRAVTKVGDLYRYNRDPRMRAFVSLNVGLEQNFEFMRNLKTPVLLLVASESWYDRINHRYVLDLYRDLSPNYLTMVTVEGNHDVHNNNPENVAPHVASFFGDAKSKL